MEQEDKVKLGVWLAKMIEFGVVAIIAFTFGWVVKDYKTLQNNVDQNFMEIRKRIDHMQTEVDGTNWRISEHEATYHKYRELPQ